MWFTLSKDIPSLKSEIDFKLVQIADKEKHKEIKLLHKKNLAVIMMSPYGSRMDKEESGKCNYSWTT